MSDDFIVPPPGLLPELPPERRRRSGSPDADVTDAPAGAPHVAPGMPLPVGPPGAVLPAAPPGAPVPQGTPEPAAPHTPPPAVPAAPPGMTLPAAPAYARPPGTPDPGASRTGDPHAAVPGVGGSRRWRFLRDGGAELAIDGPLVIGRDPVLPASRPGTRAIRIADPANSVSKTHALIEPGEHGVAVTDLHSTNGVSTASPDGAIAFLEPDVPRIVTAGTTLRFGEFEVVLDHA